MVMDGNGSGSASLAETDGWILKQLQTHCAMEKFSDPTGLAKKVWKQFRPSYIRAFNDAKDVSDNVRKGKTKSAMDDYVTKDEFRILCAYLLLCVGGLHLSPESASLCTEATTHL